MNYGLIVICDEDSDYANSLADYFRIKGCLASEIVVFTRMNYFADFVTKNAVDILIIHTDFFQSLDSIPLTRNIFVLCEDYTSDSATNTLPLYKYTSAEELLRQVMTNYEPAGTKTCLSFHKHKKGKIIGICSPLGRCGKTSLSLSLGLRLSLKASCLLISFDEASSLHIFSSDNTHSGNSLSDLLYYFFQSPDLLESKVISGTKKLQGLDYITPSIQSGIYSEVSGEDMAAFLSTLIDIGRYDYIIVDLGPLSFTFPLLMLCEHLILAQLDGDAYAELKVSAYLEFISSYAGVSHISPQRVTIPRTTFTPDVSQYLITVTSGEFAQFTASLLQADI